MYLCIYISNIYIYIYIYIYIKMVIRDPQHTECSNLTEARSVKSICNHEIMKKFALPVFTTVNLWQLMHHVPKCMSCHKVIVVITRRAHCFNDCIYIYIYIYICMYVYLKYMRVLFSEGSAGIDLFIIVNNKCSFSLK